MAEDMARPRSDPSGEAPRPAPKSKCPKCMRKVKSVVSLYPLLNIDLQKKEILSISENETRSKLKTCCNASLSCLLKTQILVKKSCRGASDGRGPLVSARVRPIYESWNPDDKNKEEAAERWGWFALWDPDMSRLSGRSMQCGWKRWD